MIAYETKIEIISDSKTIWKKLIETKNYDKWNPLIQKVEHDFELGKKTQITVVPLANKMYITPSAIIENEKLVWHAIQIHPLLLKAEHYFYLKEFNTVDFKGTRLIHGEKFTGIFSFFIQKKVFLKLSEGFDKHNQILKQISEQEVAS